MNSERIIEGMNEYTDYLDITDDRVRDVIIRELQKLKAGESQSYPVKDRFTQGDFGKIGFHSNVGRHDGEGVSLDLIEGEEEGTMILFATCARSSNHD